MYGQRPIGEITKLRGATNFQGTKVVGLNGIAVEGLDELIKQFLELAPDITNRLSEPATKCAELIATRARANVHSISGDLESGIEVRPPGRDRSNHKATRTFAIVRLRQGTWRGEGVQYGVPVELGHRMTGYYGNNKGSAFDSVPAHPFLRPAADDSKAECITIMANAMNDIIEEYSGK